MEMANWSNWSSDMRVPLELSWDEKSRAEDADDFRKAVRVACVSCGCGDLREIWFSRVCVCVRCWGGLGPEEKRAWSGAWEGIQVYGFDGRGRWDD